MPACDWGEVSGELGGAEGSNGPLVALGRNIPVTLSVLSQLGPAQRAKAGTTNSRWYVPARTCLLCPPRTSPTLHLPTQFHAPAVCIPCPCPAEVQRKAQVNGTHQQAILGGMHLVTARKKKAAASVQSPRRYRLRKRATGPGLDLSQRERPRGYFCQVLKSESDELLSKAPARKVGGLVRFSRVGVPGNVNVC